MKIVNTLQLTFSLILPFCFLISVSCVHIEPSHNGVVIDAETKQPRKDVVVHLDLESVSFVPAPHINTEYLGSAETLTDSEGKYRVPLKFYILPLLHIFADRNLIFIKPGYFEARIGEPSLHNSIGLYRMTHYLNYLAFRDTSYSSTSIPYEDENPEGFRHYREAINKMKTIKLVPFSEKGIFLKIPGRRFTKLYSHRIRHAFIGKNDVLGITDTVYYIYDENSDEWLAIDSRGKMLEFKSLETPGSPKWEFFSSHLTWGWPIYADRNAIFYPVDKSSIPKGEIKYIVPYKGNISALTGTVSDFFTIEDDSKLLCHYGDRYTEERYYSISSKEDTYGPYYLRCLEGKELPDHEEDDTLISTKFKYIVQTLNHGFFVVTKTPRYWHIYNFTRGYDEQKKKDILSIKELKPPFSSDREITTFVTAGNDFYIAFKNEGIRKYTTSFWKQYFITEERSFLLNSKQVAYSTIESLLDGWAVNYPGIYAIDGTDTIYRFSRDGTPDYQVQISE